MEKYRNWLFLVSLIAANYTMAQTIIDDATLVRKSDRRAILDITHVVSKYIYTGMSVSDASKLLTSEGFTFVDVPDEFNKWNNSFYIAVYKMESNSLFGFYDELRIVLGSVSGTVSSLQASIIYRSF